MGSICGVTHQLTVGYRGITAEIFFMNNKGVSEVEYTFSANNKGFVLTRWLKCSDVVGKPSGKGWDRIDLVDFESFINPIYPTRTELDTIAMVNNSFTSVDKEMINLGTCLCAFHKEDLDEIYVDQYIRYAVNHHYRY